MLGQGGTIWRMADARPVDADGWQSVPIDPAVLAARVAGLSYGLLVFDDTGSEWTRDGEKFSLQVFPNRFFASRESGPDTAPYLTVGLGEVDRQPPDVPSELQSDTEDLPAGEARFVGHTERRRPGWHPGVYRQGKRPRGAATHDSGCWQAGRTSQHASARLGSDARCRFDLRCQRRGSPRCEGRGSPHRKEEARLRRLCLT